MVTGSGGGVVTSRKGCDILHVLGFWIIRRVKADKSRVVISLFASDLFNLIFNDAQQHPSIDEH